MSDGLFVRLISTTICCLFPLVILAEPLDLTYQLNIEEHSDQEDRIISDFGLHYVDEYQSRRLNFQADVSANNIFEHESNDSATLWEGSFKADLVLIDSLFFVLDSEITEINQTATEDLDVLNTQTVFITKTGFQVTKGNLIRGDLSVGLFRKFYEYEKSPLDAYEDLLEIGYAYPLDSNSSMSAKYSLENQRYDVDYQSYNNADNKRLRLSYTKQFSRMLLDIYIENNSIEYRNLEESYSADAYGFRINYQVNSISNLTLYIGKDVQQSYSLNTNLIDPQNPVLASGLVVNTNQSLTYQRNTSGYSLIVQINRNDITDVSNSGDLDGVQNGLQVDFVQHLNKNFDLGINKYKSRDENTGGETDISRLSLAYTISRTNSLHSLVRLIFEEGEENEINQDDNALMFTTTAYLN